MLIEVYSLVARDQELFLGLGEGCIASWNLRAGVRELRAHGAAAGAHEMKASDCLGLRWRR